jgi:serine/threonine protein phosphatase 1
VILRRRRRAESRAIRRGAEGYRLYAIGDVHGCLDLLDGLLARIEADHLARGGDKEGVLVLLGDLIDRGPHSRQVVERVRNGPLASFSTIVLAGNHEEVFLRLLDNDLGIEPGLLQQWLSFGGAECLQSYGIDPSGLLALDETEALQKIRRAIPPEQRAFLRELGDSFSFGDYLFVHAGIRPGISLHEQSVVDLRWIRQPFLSDRRDHGPLVIHGHTISREIDERPNRIGIDTGAYCFGVLTAVAIEAGDRWFLQECAAPANTIESH